MRIAQRATTIVDATMPPEYSLRIVPELMSNEYVDIMKEQTRKPKSGTHTMERNALSEEASPDGALRSPAPFGCSDASLLWGREASCLQARADSLFERSNGSTEPATARRPSDATARWSGNSDTNQAIADELAHAMAP